MKRAQKITRVHLDIQQEDEFFLLGIVSTEPDYKLSLSINKKLGISLQNIASIKISENKASELSFSRFSYNRVSPGIMFTLISNRSGNNFLLKKLKNVDYIFQIHDSENKYKPDQISSSLKEIESVNAVFNIDINSLKDKKVQYLSR